MKITNYKSARYVVSACPC